MDNLPEETDEQPDVSLNLDNLGEGDIFTLYPRILKEIIVQQDRRREDEQRPELESTVVPSDMEWRLKVYYKLVQQQRDLEDQTEADVSALDKLRTARRWSRADSTTDPWVSLIEADSSRRPSIKPFVTSRNSGSGLNLSRGFAGVVDSLGTSLHGPNATNIESASSSTYSSPVQNALNYCGPPWGPKDVAKAARLLEKPPLPVNFEDDQEMRRVYALIYDVFRYKSVLEEALNDINFYGSCYEALERRNMTWLLLLDQQRRGWAKRECSKNPILLIRMRDAQESRNSVRRKMSISSDVSNNSDASVDSIQKKSTGGKLKKEISSETRELIRKARDQLIEGAGVISPIIEDPKLAHTTELLMKDSNKMNKSPSGQLEEIDENSNNQQTDVSNLTLFQKNEPRDQILNNFRSEYSEISLEEILKIMKENAGEIGDDLLKFDDILWKNRIKIAAAIAKIRIRNKALSLSDLLPPHLRDERMSTRTDMDTVNGWVNVFKIRGISDLMQRLNEMGYSYSTTRILDKNQFYLDKFCPRFMSIKPAHRKKFTSSSMVNDKIIVLEEREFCLGAAALCKAMKDNQLRGDVVQTHGTSPKAIGYLASQLRDQSPDIGSVYVFGTGSRKVEYENMMKSHSITNVFVFAEPANEVAEVNWSTAVAVLASPPNSYSSVQDPVDLICSRGGDLDMLQDLTECQINIEGKIRVMQILEEQKNTLKLCMTKPQIQMIIYETHSVLSTENSEMVKRAIAESNRDVREVHFVKRQKAREGMSKAPKCAMKVEQLVDNAGEDNTADPLFIKMLNKVDTKMNNPDSGELPSTSKEEKSNAEQKDNKLVADNDNNNSYNPDVIDPDSEFTDIKVPDCDIFEEVLPSPLTGLSKQEREGCFIALIQRKEMIKLNAKYMIQMAETRGLFGGNSPPPRRPQPSRTKIVKEEKPKEVKRRLSESQIERIAAPTHAWSSRISTCRSPSNHETNLSYSSECGDTERSAVDNIPPCENCLKHHSPPTPRARLWWRLAIEAWRANQPLHLPRKRAILSLNVNTPRLNVETPFLKKTVMNPAVKTPSAILTNYIMYKRGTNKLTIKKSVPQILLSELKKFIKKNKNAVPFSDEKVVLMNK